ncbi:biopolymer transporter ExbD [Brevundimonas sp.]|jgi:biopolymer transport protein ExbD|uniref:biopolymer transporter ExbD n=1 Tax=Brevundimonas sp. TaxID=1871086 RepID=UPI00184AD17B|nr:biopolymer transporter ExbD [Brevundimonas sp.]MBA4807026.1 biopolymer transporter ExbD [Brevundimonas sp.]
MAAKIKSGGAGNQVEANSDINVTPFVDIMLVLLIIFMVAAPLASVSVPVELPIAVAKAAPNPPKPVYISIQNDGDVFVGDFPTSVGALGEDLQKQIGSRNPADERIFIRGDQNTRYGDFMQVMNALQDNGFYSVALVGEDQATN